MHCGTRDLDVFFFLTLFLQKWKSKALTHMDTDTCIDTERHLYIQYFLRLIYTKNN